MQCLISAGLIGVLWVVVGYSLAFGDGNGFIGDFSMVMLNGITPESVRKSLRSILDDLGQGQTALESLAAEALTAYDSCDELNAEIERLRTEMLQAAAELEFEKAAELRDRIHLLEKQELVLRS